MSGRWARNVGRIHEHRRGSAAHVFTPKSYGQHAGVSFFSAPDRVPIHGFAATPRSLSLCVTGTVRKRIRMRDAKHNEQYR